MKTFRPVEIVSYEMNPNDPTANEYFSTTEDTMKWWESALDPDDKWAPSLLAKAIAFGGRMGHRDGIVKVAKHLAEMNKTNTVFTSRGPEFDMRIIEYACQSYNVPLKLRFSNYDSDRTYERCAKAMGIQTPPDTMINLLTQCEVVKHTASADASVEAYNAARVLWLIVIMTLDGREAMKKAITDMELGVFDPEPYVDRVEFI